MSDAHMVEQVIKYSDGTETVIKYRGVIVDGVLISDKIESMDESTAPVAPEVVEEVAEVTEESAPAESEAA